MSRILFEKDLEILSSNSNISFGTKGTKNWDEWYRYICINDKPAYEIGNICNTCSFYFERKEGADESIIFNKLIDRLSEGVESIEEEIFNSLSDIIPIGKYKALLLTIYPKQVNLKTDKDYFQIEVEKIWGLNYLGNAHNPKINYYRGTDQALKEDEKLFEFIVPIFPQNTLKQERVNFYKEQIEKGLKPTAISLSILDIKGIAFWNEEQKPEYPNHWCLAHYVLDGHHKIKAASDLEKPITIISFLAIEKSLTETEQDFEYLINTI